MHSARSILPNEMENVQRKDAFGLGRKEKKILKEGFKETTKIFTSMFKDQSSSV